MVSTVSVSRQKRVEDVIMIRRGTDTNNKGSLLPLDEPRHQIETITVRLKIDILRLSTRCHPSVVVAEITSAV